MRSFLRNLYLYFTKFKYLFNFKFFDARKIIYIYFFLLFTLAIYSFIADGVFEYLYDGFIDLTLNYTHNLFNFFENIENKKVSLLDYLNSNLYFLIFFVFFIYFFNVFFLTFATFFFGVRGVFIVCFLSIFAFWASLFFFINDFLFNSTTFYLNFDFLNFFVGTILFSFSLKIDFLNFSFVFLTVTIGLCANIYSLSYFKNEPNTDRFILLLNWFILSMSLLVISDNAILLFLGWELIGLTSFLLINFWTIRRGTLKAAIKAFTFNKMSDVFLLFFIIIISHLTNSFDLTNWENFFVINDFLNFKFINIPAIFLILASSIKSAQMCGHLWLPDSMEAPIPASALIHSATLVSAGIYLLLKFYWMLNTNFLNFLIFFLGATTTIYGAVISAAQTDCKKLLAYSTISHCGFLFITISINNVYLTVTYLYLHGLFKALTFFCVGNLVKISKGYQDTRKMGQFFLLLPIESILLLFCAINLGALPFTVGYFYKYLFQSFFLNFSSSLIVYPFLVFSMITSVIYVYRLIFYSLFDLQKSNETNYEFYLNEEYADYEHSNSTKLGCIFIFLLVLFSIFITNLYILSFSEFLINNLNVDYMISDIKYLFTKININYLLFFYAIFTSVVLLLVNIECRENFSDINKKEYGFIIFCIFLFSQLCLLSFKIISILL